MAGESVQQRFEGTAAGRALISLFILVTVVSVVVTNLPDTSYTRKTLSERTQPYVNAIGLDQAWGVFAPDPRRESIGLKARITYADGATEDWSPPERNAVFGGYSDYRWRKLMENVVADDGKSIRSEQMALWVAREQRTRREAPTAVTLIKRVSPNSPPGVDRERKPYTETQFFDYSVDPAKIKGTGP